MAGQSKTYKTIKTPVAMACVNVSNGELKVREVIMRDTATTIQFSMEYEKGYHRSIEELARFARLTKTKGIEQHSYRRTEDSEPKPYNPEAVRRMMQEIMNRK